MWLLLHEVCSFLNFGSLLLSCEDPLLLLLRNFRFCSLRFVTFNGHLSNQLIGRRKVHQLELLRSVDFQRVYDFQCANEFVCKNFSYLKKKYTCSKCFYIFSYFSILSHYMSKKIYTLFIFKPMRIHRKYIKSYYA